jgi:hypothetical protein
MSKFVITFQYEYIQKLEIFLVIKNNYSICIQETLPRALIIF